MSNAHNSFIATAIEVQPNVLFPETIITYAIFIIILIVLHI